MIDVLRDRSIYFDGPCGEVIRYDEVPVEYRAQRKDIHHELVEHLVNFGPQSLLNVVINVLMTP